MILDQHGQPIQTSTLSEPQTAQVAHLAREWESHPARGLTPARLQRILSAAEQGDLIEQLDLADDMEERDAHLFAELQKRKGALLPLEWSVVEPDGANAAEKKAAAMVREWLTQGLDDFEDILLGMMDAVLKGFAQHEMVWGLEDGLFLPQRIEFRPQRWFTLDSTRQTLLLRSQQVRQSADGQGMEVGEALRPFSWLSHIHRSRNGVLARGSLCRVLAWPYLFKNFAVRDLAEFLEIYGLPLRLGKYPAGASDEEKRRLLQAVVQIGHNAAGIIPQGMQIEFEAAADGSDKPFVAMMAYMDAAESKAIIGQTLTASEGQHGTQALGKVHNEVRLDIRNADVRQIEGTLNRQLIYPAVACNIAGISPRRMPKIKFDTSVPEDLALFADNLPKLAGSGLKIGLKWAHEKLRIPLAEDGEATLEAPKPPPAAALAPQAQPGANADPKAAPAALPKPAQPPKRADLKAQATEPGPRDALDDVIDDALAEWQPMLAPLVEPLLSELDKAVLAGESLESFRDRLPELVERMDSNPLGERLARASFVARLAGEADLALHPEA